MDLYDGLYEGEAMNRGFRSFHPFICFIYYVFAVTTIILYHHPLFLLFAVFITIGLNVVFDRGRTLIKWIPVLFIFSFLFLVITPLFNHRGNHILFFLFNNPITLEAFIQGVMNALSLFSIICLFMTFNLVISADKFLFLFAKWFPQWALLTMLSMRFVPLLKRRLQEIATVQKSKGRSVLEGTLKERISHGLLYVQILLTLSLEDGIQTADSMAARGYGIQMRTKYEPYSFTYVDWMILSFFIVINFFIIFGWWLGDGVLSLLPILESIMLEGREWLFLIIYILFLSFPLVMEIKEELQWRYWKRSN